MRDGRERETGRDARACEAETRLMGGEEWEGETRAGEHERQRQRETCTRESDVKERETSERGEIER